MADLAGLRASCTEKEARFAEAFVRSGNRTEAAREAGYKGKPSTLSGTGRKVLERAHVQAYIDALRTEWIGDPKSRLEQLLDRATHVAMGGLIEQPSGRSGKLKLRPAGAAVQMRALETAMRALGGLDPRVRVDIGPDVRAQLDAIRKRLDPEVFAQVLAAIEAVHGDGSEG